MKEYICQECVGILCVLTIEDRHGYVPPFTCPWGSEIEAKWVKKTLEVATKPNNADGQPEVRTDSVQAGPIDDLIICETCGSAIGCQGGLNVYYNNITVCSS